MQHIITQIQERLADKVPALKYIAQDWGQLDLYADFPPVKYPCALIDIENGVFTNAGHNVQEGQLSIVITISDLSNRISRTANKEMKERALFIFRIMEDIHRALQGWSGDEDYAKLTRVAMNRQIREDGARLRTLVYSTTWWDQSADQRQYAAVTGVNLNP